MQKSGQMVLKGIHCANWVHNVKISSHGLERVNWVHIDKIRSNGLERSQFGIQYKNQVLMVLKGVIGYTMIKLGQMVLKGVKWVHLK